MEIIDASHVFLDCAAATKDDVLALLAEKAAGLGIGGDTQALIAGLQAREAEGSTGMMGGFAIPHCKSAAVVAPSVVVVRLAAPVAWETMDNKGVEVAIALFIPDGEAGTEHLRILSKVAVMLMHDDFRQAVLCAGAPQEIADAVRAGLEQ